MLSADYQIGASEWLVKFNNALYGLPSAERLARAKCMFQELSDPPREAYSLLFFSGADMTALQKAEWQRSERIYAMVFGAVTIVFLAAVAVLVQAPTPFQLFVFRLIASLGAGAVGAFLPGSLTTSIERPSLKIRAGGALAVAVLIWLINPPALTSTP